jgi:hypothetical protein
MAASDLRSGPVRFFDPKRGNQDRDQLPMSPVLGQPDLDQSGPVHSSPYSQLQLVGTSSLETGCSWLATSL